MTVAATLLLAAALAPSAARAAEPWETAPPPPPMPPPEATGQVEVAGARLFYAAFGAGDPVVILHGGAGNGDHWAAQVPALARRFRVVVLDARGHGRSTRDGRPLGYHLLAEDVVAVLDALAIPRASIVGWSDGGIAALDLAIHHPERVRRLVLFGANFDLAGLRPGAGHSATFAAYLARCAADHRRLSPEPDGFPALLAALRPMWASQPAFRPADLARIRAPTLVADGERDEIVRPEHVRAMAAAIPGARLAFLPGTSHFAPWQRPEAFTAMLLGFLGEPGTRSGP